MNKPLILLDVDGVLNPITATFAGLDWKFEPEFFSDAESGRFKLLLSRQMARALTDLNCEIQWLTTWIYDQDHANPNMGKHFGWWLKIPEIDRSAKHWKYDTVRRTLESHSDRKIIWIDDEGVDFIEIFGDLPNSHNLLVISPDLQIGLTKEDINTIQKFIE
jgi:HAD domain in Swiss Army Knife RNA repair proteins